MIPDAAVEAAAEWLPHSGDCEVRPDRDCTCWQPRVNLMRAAIEAAAPHMNRTIRGAEERATVTPGAIAVDEQGNAWKRGIGSWVSTGGDTPPLHDDVDYTLTILLEGAAK